MTGILKMAQLYNQFRVIDYNDISGEVTLGWYDSTLPLTGQRFYTMGHKIPEEAEANSWTRAQYLAYWGAQVESVYEIPQFLKDEGDKTRTFNDIGYEILP
jgi:hypothetical protein